MLLSKLFSAFPYHLRFKDQENPIWTCELLLRIYKHYSPRKKLKLVLHILAIFTLLALL